MIDLWYKNAVIYSLDVETFYDANGDGVGDFEGLTQKLDYIAGLNVNCIWLLPFYASPNRDNGYDISDYYAVDPRLGTLGDFVVFTREAGERGIRVICDLVINHTSIDHPWFRTARSDRNSIFRDYYIWSDEKPADADQGMVFPGVQESTWTFDEVAGKWYFHRFYKHEPDLNTENPKVRDAIAKIMGFWLQLGVSGFRVDAAPFVIELEGPDAPPHKDDYAFLRDLRTYLSWRRGDAIMLAEANVTPESVPNYFGDGDRVQLMFNFLANQHIFLALASEKASPVIDAYSRLPAIPPTCQWANFLRNHDELDLGRLSDRDRNFVYRHFAPEEGMRLYHRGIRRRLAPMLGDRRRIEMAYSLILTLPGTPVIRYGSEIGMGEDLQLTERNCVRTPMQWSNSANAGFSCADASRLVRPVVQASGYGPDCVSVERQQREPDSLLNWFERVLRVRRRCPEIGWGKLTFLDTGDPAVLAHTCEHNERRFYAVHNFANRPATVVVGMDRKARPVNDVLGGGTEELSSDGTLRLELDPYAWRWFRECEG